MAFIGQCISDLQDRKNFRGDPAKPVLHTGCKYVPQSYRLLHSLTESQRASTENDHAIVQDMAEIYEDK